MMYNLRRIGRRRLKKQVAYYEWLTEHNEEAFAKTVKRNAETDARLREELRINMEVMARAVEFIDGGHDDAAANLLLEYVNKGAIE